MATLWEYEDIFNQKNAYKLQVILVVDINIMLFLKCLKQKQKVYSELKTRFVRI